MSRSRQHSNARPIGALALCLVLAGTTACDAIGDPDREMVSISFTGAGAAAGEMRATPAGMASSVTVSSGSNTLVIEKAQVLLRRIKLKSGLGINCPDDSGGDSSDDSDSDSTTSNPDSSASNGACQELHTGPVLVDLPLTENAVTSITALVPRGTYREIEFRIHKLGDDTPEERALASQHPEFDRASIRVEGTFNGAPFVFVSEENEDRELEFQPPIVIDEGNENVTIRLDVSRWFRTGSGGVIDPATANKGGANEKLVRDNIRASIRAFEDDDRNGR